MGFYPQPNQWLCGPFALKFALLMLGIVENEDVLARAAGTDESGSDENDLGRAARRYGCELLVLRQDDGLAARRDLSAHLRRGLPVLLCINEWNHWITAVREEAGHVVVLDSHDPAVIRVLPWETLQRLWGYHGRGARVLYDLHPLVPRRPSRARAVLSLDRARYLVQPAHRDFARAWSAIARELLGVAAPRGDQVAWSVRLADLVRRERNAILDQIDYARGGLSRERAGRLLDHIVFAAETYDLEIRPEDEARALTAAGGVLARWAAGEFDGRERRTA